MLSSDHGNDHNNHQNNDNYNDNSNGKSYDKNNDYHINDGSNHKAALILPPLSSSPP